MNIVSIEKAICIQGADGLKKNNFGRVYFGCEFCERLIPKVSAVVRILESIRRQGGRPTLLTPYCTEYGIKKLRSIFAVLSDETEIVFNDFGVLREILETKRKGFEPVLGRLLIKYKRDPRIGALRCSSSQKKYLMSSNINNNVFQQFLAGNGVRRIEIENSLQGYNFRLRKDIHVSLYYPYTYITTTASCIFKEYLNSSKCNFSCKKNVMISNVRSLPGDIITRGNTEFYFCDKFDHRKFETLNIDRIVFFPELPY